MVTVGEPRPYRFKCFHATCFRAESTTLSISIACLRTSRRASTASWLIITTWEVLLQRYLDKKLFAFSFFFRDIPKGGTKGFLPSRLPCIVPLRDIFLSDIIGYDRLKLYLKIFTPEMKSWVRCCFLSNQHSLPGLLQIGTRPQRGTFERDNQLFCWQDTFICHSVSCVKALKVRCI